jgi:hypothetical protein
LVAIYADYLRYTLLGLLDGLDDTDSNGLPHITDGETTKRRVLVVASTHMGLLKEQA